MPYRTSSRHANYFVPFAGSSWHKDRLLARKLAGAGAFTSLSIAVFSSRIPEMLTDYHNYTQLVSELESLAESYPDLSRIYSVGNSTENRELMVIQISEGVTEVKIYPAFSLVQLLHYWALIGRELQSVEIFSMC